MAYRNTIISVLVLIAAGFAILATLLQYRGSNESTEANRLPDAFMEDVVSVILDKQGKPKMKIVTPKMIHYPNGDTTHLDLPQLTIYRQSPAPWYITAKAANAVAGIDHVNFEQEVTIHHSADAHSPATVITTPKLTVFPNQQLAETNDDVTFKQPSTIIRGVGMRADMNTGDIKLLSQARGEYVPDS